jgi:uncharacterized protein (DUF1499 family)
VGGVLAIGVIAVMTWRLASLARASRAMEAPVGLTAAGALTPCPSASRCASSDDAGAANVPAIATTLPPAEALERVKAVVERLGGTVRKNAEHYLHAEFRTALWGFVDDFEARAEPGRVAVRSASRVGKSDLGANRKRIDAVRSAFLETD